MQISNAMSTFVGTVTALEVEAIGSNSAKLEFVITPLKGAGTPRTFVVESDMEPQAFSTRLTAACLARLIVTVTYWPDTTSAVLKAKIVKIDEPASEASMGRIGFR